MRVKTQRESGAVGEISFTIQIFKERKQFVAYVPGLDVSSAGTTVEEAKAHILEAVDAFIEETKRIGTLAEVLEEAGYERTPEGWKAPDLLAQERAKLSLS